MAKKISWAFGDIEDETPETPQVVPPGFRFARSIPEDAPYGKMLACRSCGALIAATDNAVSRHTTFHNRLGSFQGNLDMNYAPENPNVVYVRAEVATVYGQIFQVTAEIV
jgi:hypothetical protein